MMGKIMLLVLAIAPLLTLVFWVLQLDDTVQINLLRVGATHGYTLLYVSVLAAGTLAVIEYLERKTKQ